MKFNKILNRLQGVKKTGKNRWIAKCCSHDDRSPSLHLEVSDEGNLLMKCFAGCDNIDILNSIGCDWKDMFGESGEYTAKKSKLYASEGLRLIKDETRFFLKCMYSYRNGTLTNADIQALERRMPKLNSVFEDCGI